MRHFVRFIVSALPAIYCTLDRGSVSLPVVTWIIPLSWDTNPGLCTRRTEFVTVVLADASRCRGFQVLVSWVVEKMFNFFLVRRNGGCDWLPKEASWSIHSCQLQYSVINKYIAFFYFNTLYHTSFIILCNDQQMHNYFTNYHTPTCFDTILSSSGSL
jgi:hypothetical protein